MCGIAGYCHLHGSREPDEALLEAMLGQIAHRGPDEFGLYADRRAGLASARLSIVDLVGGTQPIGNEDGSVWIVFNGEVFNHRELRTELETEGHVFATSSDTEVIVHLYEALGSRCVERLNGQFAFAIWDSRRRDDPRLVLARDRVGIRPLFYTMAGGRLLFGSEVKALFAHPAVVRSLDPVALAQVFTLWTTIAPRTPFAGVLQVPPGHVLEVAGTHTTLRRYWDYDFTPDDPPLAAGEYAARLRELLQDATDLRLNADVTVGAYLSGGIDSSTITRLALTRIGSRLKTFSVAFEHPDFDERAHQDVAASSFGTDHCSVECRTADVGRVLPEVVRHGEAPLLRTAPAPMYLLSQLVHSLGIKVVLTGEGADEVLAGYNIFKEDRVRRFWARAPDSRLRPLLLCRLYPYIRQLGDHLAYLSAFFGRRLTDTDLPGYSHVIRWSNTAHLCRLFAPGVRDCIGLYDPVEEVEGALGSHPGFKEWTPLARAQYIEMTLFMSGYLLAAQGDRMLMAHSVEGRFPFLDHRVVELAGRMPDAVKLRGLNEKHVLKRAMAGSLPAAIVDRTKQPFRAPIAGGLSGNAEPAYVDDLLSTGNVQRAGVFRARAVEGLRAKLRRLDTVGERDEMALAGVVSTMLLYDSLVAVPPDRHRRPVRLARRIVQEGGDG